MFIAVRNKWGRVTLYAEFKASVSSFRIRLGVSQTCDTFQQPAASPAAGTEHILTGNTVCSDNVKLRFITICYYICYSNVPFD